MLFGQDGFTKTHDAVAQFYRDATQKGLNAREREELRKRGPGLSDLVESWLTNGTILYLNSTDRPSAEKLRTILAEALTPPTLGKGIIVGNSADVVSTPNGNYFYVVYAVDYCATCSNSWLGEFSRHEGKYRLQSMVKNPSANTTVHLSLLHRSSSHSTLVLYGLHWGDAHNRVDVKAFSTDGTLRSLWSRADLSQRQAAMLRRRLQR